MWACSIVGCPIYVSFGASGGFVRKFAFFFKKHQPEVHDGSAPIEIGDISPIKMTFQRGFRSSQVTQAPMESLERLSTSAQALATSSWTQGGLNQADLIGI